MVRAFHGARAIYIYGGSLDCSGGDVDVAVFMDEPPDTMPILSGDVDINIFRRPTNTLFFVYVVKTGVLIHGEPLYVNVDEALRRELGLVEERVSVFRHGEDEVMVCKSLKELMFLLAALTCGIDGSSNWYRMARCLRGLGIEPPTEFKHCLKPPDLDTLRRVGEPVLARLLSELSRFVKDPPGRRKHLI